jgi:Ran GTPase-activating protein (RanGAP) involved in mRNA processing and transport
MGATASTWSVDEVSCYLAENGFSEYYQSSRDIGVNGAMLVDLVDKEEAREFIDAETVQRGQVTRARIKTAKDVDAKAESAVQYMKARGCDIEKQIRAAEEKAIVAAKAEAEVEVENVRVAAAEQAEQLFEKFAYMQNTHCARQLDGIQDSSVNSVVALLNSNKWLTDLNLADSNISIRGVFAVVEALKDNHILKNITVNKSPLCVADLQGRTGKKHMDYSNKYLNFRDATLIGRFLRLNQECTALDVSENNLTEYGHRYDGVTDISELLKHNPNLVSLNLSNTYLLTRGVVIVASALEDAVALEHLDLKNVYINRDLIPDSRKSATTQKGQTEWSVDGIKTLGQAMEINSTLTSLNLQENQIVNTYGQPILDGARCLAASLAKNDKLTFLNLRKNNLGDLGKLAIGNALLGSEHGRIGFFACDEWEFFPNAQVRAHDLIVPNRGLLTEDAILLASVLRVNSTMTHVDISQNQLTGVGGSDITGIAALAQALKHNSTVKSINLRQNLLEIEGGHGAAFTTNLEAICESCLEMTAVDLTFNQISVQGAKFLAELIEKNTVITQLDVRQNAFGNDPGGDIIAKALLVNSSITLFNGLTLELEHRREQVKTLDLSNRGLKHYEVCWVARRLQVNENLTCLNLVGNEIEQEGRRLLAQALLERKACNVQFLMCNEFQIENADVTALNLDSKSLIDVDVLLLCGVVTWNQSLRSIDLQNNMLSFKSRRHIRDLCTQKGITVTV